MEQSAKQSIVERIKGATNILVTVSRDPSVDELAAALGLTLMLNKMDKHATAVFSGKIPSAIEFLEPSKTFENTVNSLRDFIIALDKEKADRLRYKVEDDVVRIFITPYRTTITEQDLNFSQGDFNVELVIALGVEKREDLDEAISAHGRILHDATVISINSSSAKTSLGSIDWSDGGVSSLCEMLMSLSEALQSGLLDEQIASALLTGLVAATERFSNNHTSPRVMTMAAQLMAAGANQQLIAAKLEEGHALPPVSQVATGEPKPLQADASEKVSQATPAEPTAPKSNDGSLIVEHEESEAALPTSQNHAESEAEQELSRHIATPLAPTLSVNDLRQDLAEAASDIEAAAGVPTAEPVISAPKSDWRNAPIEPTFGGTLNATTDDAEEEKHREELSNKNHKILTHEAPTADQGGVPAYAQQEPPSVDPFAEPPRADPTAPLHYEPTKPRTIQPINSMPPVVDIMPSFEETPVHSSPTLAEIEAQAHAAAAPATEIGSSVDDARAAVDAALSGNDTPLAPVADPLPPVVAAPESPALVLPPLPDFSTLPPLPSDPVPTPEPPVEGPAAPHIGLPEAPVEPAPPAPGNSGPIDPGQFRIPGQ